MCTSVAVVRVLRSLFCCNAEVNIEHFVSTFLFYIC